MDSALMSSQLNAVSPILIMTISPLPDAMKPGIHCVRTHWIRGFMAFWLVRRIRTVWLMVRAWPEPGFRNVSPVSGRYRPAAASAQVLRHLEGVADGPPHYLGVYAVRQGALDRTPAELVEHEVLGHALRVDVTELRVHPIPEFRQPHAPRLLPPRSQTRAAARVGSALASRDG